MSSAVEDVQQDFQLLKATVLQASIHWKVMTF